MKRGKTVVHTSVLNHVLARTLTTLPTGLVNRGLVRFMSLGRADLR